MCNENDSARLETLALLAFFSTMPIYSPNVVPLQQCVSDAIAMEALVHAMMTTSIASSAFLFAASLLRPRFSFTRKRMWIRSGGIMYLSGMALFLGMASALLAPTEITATAAGVLLGPGTCMMVLAWGSRLSTFNLKQALLTTCVICGSTAAINWVFSFLPSPPLIVVTAALVAAGSLYPMFSVPHETDATQEEDQEDSRESPDDMPRFSSEKTNLAASSREGNDAHSPRIGMMRRFASVMLPALIGLSMFAFFMGTSRVTVFGDTNAEVVGNMIAGALLAPLCFISSRRPFIVTLYQIAMPLGACVILCSTVLAYDFGFMESFVPLASYAFFCCIAQISLALGVASMKSHEFPPSMTWSFYLLLFSLLSSAGLLFGFTEAYGGSEFVSSSLLAVYCAFLIAHAIASFVRDSHLPAEENDRIVDEVSRFDKRCDALAKSCSLSPREREIISFLGRGHTSAFIAKSLIISESTVYTHTRNIYRKLGIGSKEELIQALSSPCEDESGPSPSSPL